MGATPKTQIPQLTRSSAEPARVPAVFLDSSTRLHLMDPDELRQLSRLAVVLVVVPNAPVKEREVFDQVAAETDVGAGASQVPSNSVKQGQTLNRDDESVFGEVKVNFPEMLAYRGGKAVVLTNIEFKMLKYLIQNARRVISRNELLNEVWGYENYPHTRTVDNHILRLRQKLERLPSQPVHFQTVHGAGYKFLP